MDIHVFPVSFCCSHTRARACARTQPVLCHRLLSAVDPPSSDAPARLTAFGTAPFKGPSHAPMPLPGESRERMGGIRSNTPTLTGLPWRKSAQDLETPFPSYLWGRTVRCAHAVRALCEKLAVLHHREFGKFRRLEGCH